MASIDDRRTTTRDGVKVATGYKGPKPWVARWRDPAGAQRSQSFARKVDAERHLTAVTSAVLSGDYVAPAAGKVTFGDRYRTWFDTTVNLRASTRARDETYARSLILPTFERRQLASIDHDAVQAWVAQLSADGYAPATVVKAHQILSKVMASAVRGRKITQNPCADTELPKIEREEQRFLSPADVARLADTINPFYRTMVLTAAYSGLRAGELYALRRSRVDLSASVIDVAETVVEVNNTHNFGPPKTRAGRRRVPVPRFVAEVLGGHLAELDGGALVFTAQNGSPMRANNFRRRTWYPACIAAGLGEMVTDVDTGKARYEGLRVHDLRHTAVAFWIAAGASPSDIARRAGHASVVTVLDRYGHLLPSDSDHVTDALDVMAREAARGAHAAAPAPRNRSRCATDVRQPIRYTTPKVRISALTCAVGVELNGIEPSTSALQRQRSAN